MATATNKRRAAKSLAHDPAQAAVPEPMQFLIYEDNGGLYHWTIVDDDRATLAHSDGFASDDEAKRAAQRVRDGAPSARFERRAVGKAAVDRFGRRDPRKDTDAKRWLDEGGDVSSKSAIR